MRMEDEPMGVIGETTADILVHTHIAQGQTRTFPLDESEDIYNDFFTNLGDIGYGGRVSIEAGTKDINKEGPASLALLKRLTS